LEEKEKDGPAEVERAGIKAGSSKRFVMEVRLLGFVTSNTMGSFIRGLLVIAVVVVLVRVIRGRL
jgi:hypothetical protein